MEEELEPIVELLAAHAWPFRLHATYDESIDRFLTVFERVQGREPFRTRFIIDHAETVSPRNIERIAALGGGIAIQHRMAFQGEAFVSRYGAQAARATPPVRRMLEAGVPVGAGTDATRVASYDPLDLPALARHGARPGGGEADRRGGHALARGGSEALDPRLGLVLGRGGRQGPAQARGDGRPRRALGRLLRGADRGDPPDRLRAHDGGRADRTRRGRVRGSRAAPAARLARLEPGQRDAHPWDACSSRARGGAARLPPGLRLGLRPARARPRDGLAQPGPRARPRGLSGGRSAAPAGRCERDPPAPPDRETPRHDRDRPDPIRDRRGSRAPAPAPSPASGPWAPFAHRAFAVLWTATVISNVGTWMNDVGAGWLMTELSPSPLVVAAVQAATTLPVFLFALPAGAVADIVDRRRLLLVVNVMLGAAAAGLAALVAWGAMTPALLLLFTFLLGSGAAFLAPAWQAIVPRLVPREELPSAIALNSMGINVSRAIGPALAGALIVAAGLWAPFTVNALSFAAIIAALLWWTPPEAPPRRLPPEHVAGAIWAGLRHAAANGPLRATLLRAGAFFLFASAYWATLPLIARTVLGGGPTLYGILLGAVGAGAVGGALVLPAIRTSLGTDRTVAAGTLGTALVLALFAVVPSPVVAGAASALAGASWIAVLSSLHVSAQTALPDWVRARGLSVFLTVFFGAMSAGSLLWGQVASTMGIPAALLIAAAGAVVTIPLTWRAKLGQGAGLDLAPSLHWPAPPVLGRGVRGSTAPS